MSYLALYRKWRPKKFSDLVGQDHVARTLKNALEKNKVSHAYLFSGMRGTGKTSTAKILSKALNCLNLKEGEPCNQCTNCLKINEGSFMDIIEIDAASNRGIDEIRDLREKIKFMPVEGEMKVYIIDEVHMLTGEAFNALLKTLEEPPGYIVFILATTEAHKIPLTILSRCQKFDFRKIPNELLVERLKIIIEDSNGDIEEEAISLIAKLAGGGLRDAISLLDQCLTSFNKRITPQDVSQISGIVDDKMIAAIFKAIGEEDIKEVISLYEEIKDKGKSTGQLLHDLIEGFKNILVIKAVREPEKFIAAGKEVIESYKEIAGLFSQDEALAFVYALGELEGRLKYSIHPDLLLEVDLLRLVGSFKGEAKKEDNTSKKENRESEAKVKAEKSREVRVKPMEKQEEPTIEDMPPVKKKEEIEELSLNKIWDRFMKEINEKNKTLNAYYKEVGHKEFEGNKLKVFFDEKYEFHKIRAQSPENLKTAEGFLREIAGRKIVLELLLNKDEEAKGKSVEDKLVEIFGDMITYIEE